MNNLLLRNSILCWLLCLAVDLDNLALMNNLLLRNSILCWLLSLALLPACLLSSSGLCRGQLQRKRLCPDLNASVMILHLVSHGLLVGTCAASKQSPDTECIVLGRDYLLAPHPVHAGQVLLVHDILLYALPRARFVSSFQPR